MDAPTNDAEVCQFIHRCRWISTRIPDFQRKIQPLNEILENAFQIDGKRRKSALSNIAFHKLSQGTVHSGSKASIQDSSGKAAKLWLQKTDHATCISTDASERFSAGILTQTK